MRADTPLAGSMSAHREHGEPSELDQSDYCQRYGLTIDPFAEDPYFPFFKGGLRGEMLEQLLHVCQFGQTACIVQGARSVGKSRLALALYETLGEERVCFIGAVEGLSLAVTLQHIATHAGFEVAGASNEQLIAALTDPHNYPDEPSFTVILVDDAHYLSADTISTLLNLSAQANDQTHRFQIILFGDTVLSENVRQSGVGGLGISEFILEPLNAIEAYDYLNHRLDMADYLGADLFTENKVEGWWREARNQLVPLHEKAREHLLDSVIPLVQAPKSFPLVHIIAASILGCAVLMAFLYRSGDNSETISTERIPLNLQAPQRAESAELSSAVSSTNTQAVIAPLLEQQVSTELNPITESGLADTEVSPVEPLPPPVPPVPVDDVVQVVQPQPMASVSSAQRSSASSVVAKLPISRVYSDHEQTLLSWRPADYTLQLLGVSVEKAARDFMARQPNQSELLLFKTKRQNKDWFVVVVGRFASTAQAKSAIAGLPSEQSKAGPWPRELRGIQQELQ